MPIHHVVFIKFKSDASREAIDTFVEELNKIPEMNPEVTGWISGFSPEPRFHNGDFDFGLAGDLPDADGMERYMFHESHIRMIPYAEAVIDYMLSFDFCTDYIQPDTVAAQRLPATPKEADAGAGRVQVPSVLGRKLDDAVRIIEAANLRAGATEKISGTVWVAGRVIGQDPAAGAVVHATTAVNLGVTDEFWMRPNIA